MQASSSTVQIITMENPAEETNRVVAAELDFLATPMNVEYANAAYEKFQEIHQQCAVDYAAKCSAGGFDSFSLNDFFANFEESNLHRKLSNQKMDFVQSVRQNVHGALKLYSNPKAKSSLRGKLTADNLSSRSLFGFWRPHEGSDSGSDEDESHHKNWRGRPRNDVKPERFLPPADGDAPGSTTATATTVMGLPRWQPQDHEPRPREPAPDRPRDRDGESPRGRPGRGEGEGHYDEQEQAATPPPSPRHRRHVPEDNMYMGSLGYGAAGDTCLYQNFESLSAPCQDGVRELFALRQEFWQESQGASHHCHGLGLALLFAGAAILGGIIRRRRYRKVITILNAINANPELKAAVEAKSGEKVPVLPQCRYGRSNCCGFLCRVLLSVFMSLFIVLTSGLIAAHIIMSMTTTTESGEMTGPSYGAAILIWLSCVAVETLAFVGVVRLCRGRRRSPAVQPLVAAAAVPTAPVMHSPTFSFSGIRSVWGSSNAGPSEGYMPLPGDESGHTASSGTEMVYVHQPVISQVPAVYVPVSAAPVSNITLI